MQKVCLLKKFANAFGRRHKEYKDKTIETNAHFDMYIKEMLQNKVELHSFNSFFESKKNMKKS